MCEHRRERRAGKLQEVPRPIAVTLLRPFFVKKVFREGNRVLTLSIDKGRMRLCQPVVCAIPYLQCAPLYNCAPQTLRVTGASILSYPLLFRPPALPFGTGHRLRILSLRNSGTNAGPSPKPHILYIPPQTARGHNCVHTIPIRYRVRGDSTAFFPPFIVRPFPPHAAFSCGPTRP